MLVIVMEEDLNERERCMSRKHSLYTFSHRILIYRLVSFGLAISIILGLVSLFVESGRIKHEVTDIAMGRLAIFIKDYNYLFADPDNLSPNEINQAFLEFSTTRNVDILGSFILASIYDIEGRAVTSVSKEQSKGIKEVRSKQHALDIKKLVGAGEHKEFFWADGLPYLRVATPLFNKSQQQVGTLNIFFEFSDEAISDFYERGLRSMLVAILIVFLTTAILYPVIFRLTQRITRFAIQLLDANLNTMEILGNAIALRDNDTRSHNYRVSIYAVRIGEEMGLSVHAMRTLIKGSFLHDVGKLGIPDEILLKPGKLDDKEFEIMKTHVELGREIIHRAEWMHDALAVVLCHHEQFSGVGYIKGLKGNNIPVSARIFAVADVFDALTSKRVYKKAWSFDEAMEIIKEGSGSHFDPEMVDAFSRVAQTQYSKFIGDEDASKEELATIIDKYFREKMDRLEY